MTEKRSIIMIIASDYFGLLNSHEQVTLIGPKLLNYTDL